MSWYLGKPLEQCLVPSGYSGRWLESIFQVLQVCISWFIYVLNTYLIICNNIRRWGGFPGGPEYACQCKRYLRRGFNPWARKISWSRQWQPTPVFLPGKFHGQRSLTGFGPWSCRVGPDWATEHTCTQGGDSQIKVPVKVKGTYSEILTANVWVITLCSSSRLNLYVDHFIQSIWQLYISYYHNLHSFFFFKSLSHVRLFVTQWTIACQAPPSMGFSRQEHWSGLPFPSPGDLPNKRIEPGSPAFQADSLPTGLWGKPLHSRQKETKP